jgi:outer membrane protein insertion porin family
MSDFKILPMKLIIRYFLGIIVWLQIANAQARVVQTIEWQGLKKTKSSYVSRFLAFQIGEKLDSLKIIQTQQQLMNLRIFREVSFEVKFPHPDSAAVVFVVSEILTTLPIFDFGGIKGNIFLQVGLENANWLGNGSFFKVYYQHSNGHSFFWKHYSPFLGANTRWGLRTNLIKLSTLESAKFRGVSPQTTYYNYDNIALNASLVYQIKIGKTLEFGGGYQKERFRKNLIKTPPNDTNLSQLLNEGILLKSVYSVNRVNFKGMMQQGFSHDLYAETVIGNSQFGFFYKIFDEMKAFLAPSPRVNWGFRLRVGLASNSANPFAPFILDSFKNIRGVGNHVDRGTAEITLNVEYRYRLWQNKWGALQAALFVDTGAWRTAGGSFSDLTNPRIMQTFTGGGARLQIPQLNNIIFRADYAFDIRNSQTNGLVIGLGQFF